MIPLHHCFFFFFFNDTATTEIYTLSLHDALPILLERRPHTRVFVVTDAVKGIDKDLRSEEHTSELQSQSNLVCRLLLEKKKKSKKIPTYNTRQTMSILTTTITPHRHIARTCLHST